MADDTISRQAAIDALLHNQEVYSNNFGNDPIDKYTIAIIDNDAQTIAQLPSAQRTGRWKVSDLPKGKMKYCSECGFGQYIADERQYRFCPNCGADMRGEQDECNGNLYSNSDHVFFNRRACWGSSWQGRREKRWLT